MANVFENPFGNHEKARQAARGIGAVAIFGGMMTAIGTACSISMDTDTQNRHALDARKDLYLAVADSTGSELVDMSGPNRNMAGWFIDQDHMMVALGKPSDIPASLRHLKEATNELNGTRFNDDVKRSIDAELAHAETNIPTGSYIPKYSERVLGMAKDVFAYANNGNMIDSNDTKVWGASAGVAAIGASMIWLAARRPDEA